MDEFIRAWVKGFEGFLTLLFGILSSIWSLV